MKLPEWSHSLQIRLAIGFAALLSMCLFAASAWATYNTRLAIEDYRRETERFRDESARRLLQEVYDYNQDLSHVQNSVQQIAHLFSQRVAVVDSKGYVVADSHDFPEDFEGNYQKEDDRFDEVTTFRTVPIYLAPDVEGKVIFVESSRSRRPQMKLWLDRDLRRNSLHSLPEKGPIPKGIENEAVEVALRNERLEGEALTFLDEAISELAVAPQLSALQNEFQKSLIVSGVAGSLAGILIVAFFTRRAFAPMRELTTAAHRIGQGNLSQRVKTDSRGEIGHLATTFNTMASELESLEKRRRRLTADVAHELRTPLTNIRGYLEAIKDDVVKPEEETIEILYQETLHLSSLVEDLRLLAIADAGALHLDLIPERIDTIVNNVVTAFHPRANETGIRLVCDIEEALPLVDIDQTRMTQIIYNLVENAIRHTPWDGEVAAQVSKSDIVNYIEISVSDTGEGIASDEIDYIFDQFYRVDTARSRLTGGTGLGLTIVKRLVEAHGARISVQSKADSGSKFTILMPVSRKITATD